MAPIGDVLPRYCGTATPNAERPSCGFADDSWEEAAIGWWGGEP
ncbi:hypothetical protein [Brevibacterium spongiae]|nr:hypothetical protein [Brevibacterium spongiae]